MSTHHELDLVDAKPQCLTPELFDTFSRFFNLQPVLDPNGNHSWAIRFEDAHHVTTSIYFDLENRQWSRPEPAQQHNTHTSLPYSSPQQHRPRSSSQPLIQNQHISPLQSRYWADFLPPTEHVDIFRNTNWTMSPAGPLSSWPISLRCYTYQLFADERASIIYWGFDRVAIYNAHTIPLLGLTHPGLMGAAFQNFWPETGFQFEQIFNVMELTGSGMTISNYNLFLDRIDYNEETYWTGALTPLRDDQGAVGGFYCCWTETTREVISDRRTKLIDDLGRTTDIPGFSVWDHFCQTFATQPREINMAMVFSAKTDILSGDQILSCEGSIGISGRSESTSFTINLERDQHGWAPILREAQCSPSGWMLLHHSKCNYPAILLQDMEWQAFGEPSQSIVIIPLTGMDQVLHGFIVIGLNPRRPFDPDTRSFVSDLSRQLTAVTSAGREWQIQLHHQLEGGEQQRQQTAQICPVGMYEIMADDLGHLKWANPQFFELLGSQIETVNFENLQLWDFILDEDLPLMRDQTRRCIEEQVRISHAFRLKRHWSPALADRARGEINEEPVWILHQAYPRNENGLVTSIVGCFTDISEFKYADKLQSCSAGQLDSSIKVTGYDVRNSRHGTAHRVESIQARADSPPIFILEDASSCMDLSNASGGPSPVPSCAFSDSEDVLSTDSTITDSHSPSPTIACTHVAVPLDETTVKLGLEILLVGDSHASQMILSKQSCV